MNIHAVKAFRMGSTIVNDNLFPTYFAYFLLIETTFAAEEIIILSHTESTLTTDSAKVFWLEKWDWQFYDYLFLDYTAAITR